MRINNKIIKINKIEFPLISFVSRNGEYRSINIVNYFKNINLKKDDFGYEIIENIELFNSVSLIDNALAWVKINKIINLPSGNKIEAFFHLDPILTIDYSEIISNTSSHEIGDKVRNVRKQLNITQDELAKRIGTSKHYISKVENSKTDIEFKTLKKIFEVGLNKRIHIDVYDDLNKTCRFSNSVLNPKFIEWASTKKNDLTLIEGIGPKVCKYFREENINSPQQLSVIDLSSLVEILGKTKKPLSFYHNVDSWLLQAKCLANSDWTNLIMVQKAVGGNNSKIEDLAKRELREDIFNLD